MDIRLDSVKEILDNNKEELNGNINITNELLVDEIMLCMGYNKKRIRGIHRIYDSDIDWEVQVGDSKRFIIDTVPYGTSIEDEQIQFLNNYCIENKYPFGFITNGDDFVIVSGCVDDEQPILRQSVIKNPEEASKLLDLYNYKQYDSSKIKEYYMQFQFTLDKLKERLKQDNARQAMYETAEQFAECKPQDRNKGIIKQFIDKALDGNTLGSTENANIKQLEQEKQSLELRIDELSNQLQDAQSKMDAESTERSELQYEIDRLNSVIKELNEKPKEAVECSDDDKLKFEELQCKHDKEIEQQKDYYESEIRKLSQTIDEIKQAQETKEGNVIVQAGALTVDQSETEEQLTKQLAAKQVELDRLTSQVDESKQIIVKLTNEKSELIERIDRLEEQIKETESNEQETESNEQETESNEQKTESNEQKTESNEQELKIASLTEELNRTKKQLELLNIELESVKSSHIIQADEIQLEIGNNNSDIIKQLITENNQLKTQLKLMIESGDLSQQADAFAVEVAKYREQIQQLVNDNTRLEQEIGQQKIVIDDLNNKLVMKGTAKQVEAMELLDSIEDDPNQERTYVAVIDDNLFQERNIKRFIGICIEELYKTAAVQLMPILYDSQNFMIKEAKANEQCDLTLGTKRFNIDIENDTEDSLMAKAVQLYAQYKDRVFYCKKIGTPKADFDDLYKGNKTCDENQIVLDDETNETESKSEENSVENNANVVDLNTDSQVQNGQVIGYGYFGIRGSEQLFNYEYATCRNIQYVYTATNERYYKIDTDQLEQQLVTAVQALIAACPSNIIEQQLMEYHNLNNFQQFSNNLATLQTLNKQKLKMPMNRLAIESISTMKELTDILTVVADIFGYSEEDVTLMYEMSYFADDDNLQSCLADIDTVQSLSNIDYPGDQTGELFEKGIDGGIIDNTILSRNSLEIQSKLFRGLTRVITEDLNYEIVDDSQFQNAVSKMMNKAISNKRKIDPKMFGFVVGTTNKQIISTNKTDVGDRYVQVKAGNQIYYVARLEPVQQIYAFIRMQQVLFGNKQIKFMVNVSNDAYNFYKNEFITSNPSLDLIVNTIIKYIDTRL